MAHLPVATLNRPEFRRQMKPWSAGLCPVVLDDALSAVALLQGQASV